MDNTDGMNVTHMGRGGNARSEDDAWRKRGRGNGDWLGTSDNLSDGLSVSAQCSCVDVALWVRT